VLASTSRAPQDITAIICGRFNKYQNVNTTVLTCITVVVVDPVGCSIGLWVAIYGNVAHPSCRSTTTERWFAGYRTHLMLLYDEQAALLRG